MRILARQRFDPRATYDITAPGEGKLGEIRKVFGQSLIRSTYEISGPSGTITARERSLPVALFRRLVGLVPYVGDLADWVPIPYHFEFRRGDDVVATHSRRFGSFRDVYDIEVAGDPGRTIDRRLILAAAVGMDALQAR